MSEFEECLKRSYPEVKFDESDESETRTHVIKCYNKDQPKKSVVSHTEWEKSETTKSNEKSANKIAGKTSGPCPTKPDIRQGNKSPKKVHKEMPVLQKELPVMQKEIAILQKEMSVIQKELPVIHKELPTLPKEMEICKKKEKDVNKFSKEEKLSKEEKKKKLKKAIKR